MNFGYACQLEAVLRRHLGVLCRWLELLPGADVRAFVDIDSLLRAIYGHACQYLARLDGAHTRHDQLPVVRLQIQPTFPASSRHQHAPHDQVCCDKH